MSSANRKRKSGAREPNGRPQRSTVQQLKDMERDRSISEMKTVMGQPHRRGLSDPTDPRAESAFGRFCIRRRLRLEIRKGAEDFARLVRGWRAAVGVPTELRLPQEGGNGLGPSDDAVRAWAARIAKIEHAVLARVENGGYLAFRTMVLDDLESDHRLDGQAQVAAFWLAVEMGAITPRESPFSTNGA